jgi:hypothetical protein
MLFVIGLKSSNHSLFMQVFPANPLDVNDRKKNPRAFTTFPSEGIPMPSLPCHQADFVGKWLDYLQQHVSHVYPWIDLQGLVHVTDNFAIGS